MGVGEGTAVGGRIGDESGVGDGIGEAFVIVGKGDDFGLEIGISSVTVGVMNWVGIDPSVWLNGISDVGNGVGAMFCVIEQAARSIGKRMTKVLNAFIGWFAAE